MHKGKRSEERRTGLALEEGARGLEQLLVLGRQNQNAPHVVAKDRFIAIGPGGEGSHVQVVCVRARRRGVVAVGCFNGQGTTQDLSMALTWFSKSAAQGYAQAQLKLGVMYATGKGVEKNLNKAVELYEEAAHNGLADAQYNLGYCHQIGAGTKQDDAEAANWYLKAGHQNHEIAQGKSGAMYLYGKGVPKDLVQAYFWFLLAARHGNPNAMNARDSLAPKLTPEEIAQAESLSAEFLTCREKRQ